MKLRSTSVALVLTGALILAATGCHHRSHRHHHHNPAPVVNPGTVFTWDATVLGYSNDESYFWKTPFDDAIVEFEAFDFEGAFTIEIYDHLDELVYFETFYGDGGDYFSSAITDLGVDGDWLIYLTSDNVDGELHVWIE
ncbi:MAG: hypothetical protein ACKVX7_00820 [Planctomycetota bacterium]